MITAQAVRELETNVECAINYSEDGTVVIVYMNNFMW